MQLGKGDIVLISMNDIAKKLNLSRTTISNILNNKSEAKNYRDETVELVRKTARELGYIPNDLAKSLIIGKTMIVAIIVPDLSNTYYVNIIKEAELLFTKIGYRLNIFTSEESITKENNILEYAIKQRFDGILIAPVSLEKSLSNEVYRDKNIVCFDRKVASNYFKSVTIDNYLFASSVSEKYILLNADYNIYFGSSLDDFTVKERLLGFKEFLNLHSMGMDKEFYGIFNSQQSYTVLNKYIKTLRLNSNCKLNIFLSSNYYSLGIVQAFKKNNITNYKIIGFDEAEWTDVFSDIPIKSIKQPINKIANEAVEILLSMIDN